MSDEESKKEKIREYQHNYKIAHRADNCSYMKDYVAQSPTIKCPCGGIYKMYSGYKHKRTAKHLKFLEYVELQAKTAEPEPPLATVVCEEVVEEKKLADFVDVEQLGSLMILKPKEASSEKKKKQKLEKIVIEEHIATVPEPVTMEEYVEKVKEVLSPEKKKKVVKREKVVKFSAPKTEAHNVVA
jgi:hypothetical protein